MHPGRMCRTYSQELHNCFNSMDPAAIRDDTVLNTCFLFFLFYVIKRLDSADWIYLLSVPGEHQGPELHCVVAARPMQHAETVVEMRF